MTQNPKSNLVSSLFNTEQTLSSLMTQSNRLAKLTGEASLIGKNLEHVLFVCNSEIMASAFSQIIKGINPGVTTDYLDLSSYTDSNSEKDNNCYYNAIVLILSDRTDLEKICNLQNKTINAEKFFVIAPQSFNMPSLSELNANIMISLESSAELMRDCFLKGIQGEKLSVGFVDKLTSLTPRQKDVLELIQAGRNNKEIARELDISMSTIKAHCSAIFRELGVSSRLQVMAVLNS